MGSIILLVEHSIALWSQLYFSIGLSKNSLGCTSFVVKVFFCGYSSLSAPVADGIRDS